ncbi:hypothetical protein IV203_015850 [Nitzschia inconspicua]|uniref:Uncharacterized protein n=1 Tax=Nitzschia inconspicua TaxID=303405 RepID=A0A9K3PTY6_9STRA|nr:hypothetical protein IV203_015850 [Nitzschia inconspicua]
MVLSNGHVMTSTAPVVSATPLAEEVTKEEEEDTKNTTTTPTTSFSSSSRRRPWQVDWKRPQWVAVRNNNNNNNNNGDDKNDDDDTNQDDRDDTVVVGVTTAQISIQEALKVLSQQLPSSSSLPPPQNVPTNTSRMGDPKEKVGIDSESVTRPATATAPSHDNESRFLLSVSLLAPSIHDGDDIETDTGPCPLLASEVLLEIIDTASQSTQTTQTPSPPPQQASVVAFSKRLSWPETARQTSATATTNLPVVTPHHQRSKKKKRHNIFSAFVMPLFGIDEEDGSSPTSSSPPPRNLLLDKNDGTETVVVTNSDSCRYSNKIPNRMGLVSATLCRRLASSSERSGAMDLISLMNLGMPQSSDTNHPTERSRRNLSEPHDDDDDDDDDETAVGVETDQNHDLHGDLFLVCVSQEGKIFVYNPWKLLLGNSNNNNNNNQQNQDTEDHISQFFLGQSLYQTLQESYKPLSEPLATVRLSVFEHDNNNNNTADWEHQTKHKNSTSTTNTHDDHDHDDYDSVSILSESSTSHPSTVSLQPASSLLTSTSKQTQHLLQQHQARMTHHRQRSGSRQQQLTKRRRQRQHNIIDPFLWNPLLESSTLPDRTLDNRPISITVAGSSYIVIMGKGRPYANKRKRLRAKLRHLEQQQRQRRHLQRSDNSLQRNEQSLPLTTQDEPTDLLHPSKRQSQSQQQQQQQQQHQRHWWESSKDLSNKEEQQAIPSNAPIHSHYETHVQDDGSVASSVTSNTRAGYSGTTATAVQEQEEGGFVTFVSSSNWSESKTLFLSFVPTAVSHIDQWNDMELVMVLGKEQAILIRIDSDGPVAVPIGTIDEDATTTEGSITKEQQTSLILKKFQIVPIDMVELAEKENIPRCVVGGSGFGVKPPSLLELYLDENPNVTGQNTTTPQGSRGLLLCKQLGHFTEKGTVALHHDPLHTAQLTFSTPIAVNDKQTWAQHGQGWSLLSCNEDLFFVCWEGSTSRNGSFVQRIRLSTMQHTSKRSIPPQAVSNVLPMKYKSNNSDVAMQGQKSGREDMLLSSFDPRNSISAMTTLPFSTPFSVQTVSQDTVRAGDIDVGVILQAMEDLSTPDPILVEEEEEEEEEKTGEIKDERRTLQYSYRRRSERLLRHCSSWTQLQDTLDDRAILEQQVPMLVVRLRSANDTQFLYTLRQLVVINGPASPFQQVLAWLAKGGDYFTAASVALDLLHDGDTLFHLWKNAEMVDEEEEESKLDGLLDGIIPIQLVDDKETVNNASGVNVVHLADMTVGCLIKGGGPMAATLRLFLKENQFYDPARACLMLAATTARMMGDAAITVKNIEATEDLLWPVDCLLQIGRSRDYLDTVLQLLNVTIPDELRNRRQKDEEEHFSKFGLETTKRLVAMIVASDPLAIDILLDLLDEGSHDGYWNSLNSETQLELSLIQVESAFPMIRNPEIRAWVREELNMCLKEEIDLPTAWIQRLTTACLSNAGCELSDFQMDVVPNKRRQSVLDSSQLDGTGSTSSLGGRGESLDSEQDEKKEGEEDDDDGINILKMQMVETRNALVPPSDGYSLDFDLLIPCLLLLQVRNVHWLGTNKSETLEEEETKKYVSTQTLLNAACYLAGRRPKSPVVLTTTKKEDTTDEKPFLFADFDSSTAMKQCYLAGNVSAGAYLIGGKNGFVLHVCQILHEFVGLSIHDAEGLVLNDNLDLQLIETASIEVSSFELTDGHRKLLLLLDEHVLSVKTFGEFETIHIRGRVEPVFVARSVFRAWLSLSYGDKKSASQWLSGWLSRRLEIGVFSVATSSSSKLSDSHPREEKDVRHDESSSLPPKTKKSVPPRHRLACASIARSLLWPSNADSFVGEESYDVGDSPSPPPPVLAIVMELEVKFVVEICEACVGLVESVPPRDLQEMKILVEAASL